MCFVAKATPIYNTNGKCHKKELESCRICLILWIEQKPASTNTTARLSYIYYHNAAS